MLADVAEWMMNRCINCGDVEGNKEAALPSLTEAGRNSVVEYSFQFLEDFQEECPKFPFMNYMYLKTGDSPR